MKAIMHWSWVVAGLLGGLSFLMSCSNSGDTISPEELYFAHRAELALLQAVPIDSGAVVSFVGAVPQNASLCHPGQEGPTICLTVPDTTVGRTYLYFINDHPDQRYTHPVRYAWLNLSNGAFDTLSTDMCPYLDIYPQDTTEFQLIEAETRQNVLFYFGCGGGHGFPATHL